MAPATGNSRFNIFTQVYRSDITRAGRGSIVDVDMGHPSDVDGGDDLTFPDDLMSEQSLVSF